MKKNTPSQKTRYEKIVIPGFTGYVKLADKIRPTYYKQGTKKIPKKYQGPQFVFKNKKLFNTQTNEFVIANINRVNTPKYHRVNMNDIYSGNLHHFSRNKMMHELHEYFIHHLRDVKEFLRFPLRVELQFHVVDKGKFNLDCDNMFLYLKAFNDSLTLSGLIPDDNPDYISEVSIKVDLFNGDVTNQTLTVIIEELT